MSVRSANRAARTAERALEAGLRPVLVQSKLQDPAEKIMWIDRHWALLPGGHATVELYIPAGDTSFWQGAIREPDDPVYQPMCAAIQGREMFTIDLLYGDHEGGQRIISRFAVIPRDSEDGGWLCNVAKHWNIDRQDPR